MGGTLAEKANRTSIRRTKEMKMSRNDVPESGLDELEPEVVEDLDVDEDAADIRGGTTFNCPTSH